MDSLAKLGTWGRIGVVVTFLWIVVSTLSGSGALWYQSQVAPRDIAYRTCLRDTPNKPVSSDGADMFREIQANGEEASRQCKAVSEAVPLEPAPSNLSLLLEAFGYATIKMAFIWAIGAGCVGTFRWIKDGGKRKTA